jgi:hypothetical protein
MAVGLRYTGTSFAISGSFRAPLVFFQQKPQRHPNKPELTIEDLWMSLRSVIFMIVFYN